MTLIAVTGASGALGGRVARRLVDRGVTPRLVVRDPARAPQVGAPVATAGYHDPAAMREAFAGVDALLLVSASESVDRLEQHLAAVDAAAAAGVGRVIYTSFLGAAPECAFTLGRQHWHTEERIRATGLPHTILRDSLYQDVFPYFVGEDGVIRGPAGDGRLGAVTRDDIADAAVAVLLADPAAHDGRTYDLTGPEAITLDDIAQELSRAAGRPITYHAETVEEAYASRARFGAERWEVDGWVSSYTAIAADELDVVTDHIAVLAGHPATSFAAFLTANPEALAHLRRG